MTDSFETYRETVKKIVAAREKLLAEALAEIVRLRAASEWRPVYDEVKDEMLPLADTEYLLGWWSTWPELQWRQEVSEYRNSRGHWCHGQATHFRHLPAPPQRNEVTK